VSPRCSPERHGRPDDQALRSEPDLCLLPPDDPPACSLTQPGRSPRPPPEPADIAGSTAVKYCNENAETGSSPMFTAVLTCAAKLGGDRAGCLQAGAAPSMTAGPDGNRLPVFRRSCTMPGPEGLRFGPALSKLPGRATDRDRNSDSHYTHPLAVRLRDAHTSNRRPRSRTPPYVATDLPWTAVNRRLRLSMAGHQANGP
jgi:hypothetical protein